MKQEGWNFSDDQADIESIKKYINNLNKKKIKDSNKIANVKFILLEGYKGELAFVEYADYYKDRYNFNLTIRVSLSLGVKDLRIWVEEARKFFNHVLISKVELVEDGKAFESIKKRPYKEIKIGHKSNARYKFYSDAKPKGTLSAAKEKACYRNKRNIWIKNEYRRLRKEMSQDDAYYKIQVDLEEKELNKFGKWPDRKYDTKSRKWVCIGNDPRKLSFGSIKNIVQKKNTPAA